MGINMKLKKNNLTKAVMILLSTFLLFGFTANSTKKKQNSQDQRLGKTYSNPFSVGDSYYMFINDIAMPMNSKGVIADVVVEPYKSQGRINGLNFLYSSGFYMSGVNDKGIMWSNAMATSSRTSDYLPGNAAWDDADNEQVTDPTYSGIFVVKAKDEPFGDSWVAWGEAVKGGAYFYDGDGDGEYNPVDKNGNGQWDPDEDSPDILGDETAWCVYNDAVSSSDRTFTNVDPQGIEIRQTVWAYATAGDLGKIMFIRYSILNTGLVSDVQDSVYFGVWADADIGDALDDLVGSDTTLNAGYTYNDGSDGVFGSTPPCFLIDFFQGPWEPTGNPDDFALNTMGPILGVDTIWGAKNLGLTSFVYYIQSHPTQGDPDNEVQARNYLEGFNQQGNKIDACDWEFGTVFTGDCAQVDTRYIYSGDPVSQTGWIHTSPYDQRQMSNTGPFKLEKGKAVDVVVAYVVGRSTSAIASVKEAKKIDRAAQFVFQNNFNVPAAPPQVTPVIKANDNTIELIWETYESTQYEAVGVGYDMHFEWYEVKMYNRNSTSDIEGGKANSQIIARYDIKNDINSVIYENPVNDERTIIYPTGGIQLDSSIYFDKDKGRISLIIKKDPFTGKFLEKNKPYFLSIVSTALNYDEIVKFDALGTYLIPGTATLGSISNIPLIINDDKGNDGILTGDSQNEPFYSGVPTEHVSGEAESEVTYSVQDKEKITNHKYEVGFFRDSLSIPYVLYYYIKDVDRDTILVDSSKKYLFSDTDFDNNPFFYDDFYTYQINNLVDGVTVTVPWIEPGVGKTEFKGNQWFLPQDDSITGGFYVGNDVSKPSILPVTSKTSSAISVGDLRPVEIRFGAENSSFAHRYVRRATGRYPLGDNTGSKDSSFVEVPFSAFEVLPSGEERQLAVGFTETANAADSLGMPDGVWYPGSQLTKSKEYIIVFKAPYDPTGTVNLPYISSQSGRLWADIATGYKMDKPADFTGNYDSLKAVAKSAWFDAMYVCGFETDMPRNAFNPTGTYKLFPGVFLTDRDKYQYTVETGITKKDAESNWDKVNVFPNPLFGINEGVSYTGGKFDEPYVTFNNLPDKVTIKLYTISGVLVRTLEKDDASSILRWNLENESELRVASGMYIALISNPEFGDKILKLAIIMPQKQLQNY